MITLAQYFMGRDTEYAADLTTEILNNASETVALWNALLEVAALDGVVPPINPHTGSQLSSGWRPPEVNDATSNAAAASKHLTGQAGDVFDPEKKLADWVRVNLLLPVVHALFFEDFRCTATWVHGQSVPPRSGNHVYIPTLAWVKILADQDAA